jgi:hypothetical protein
MRIILIAALFLLPISAVAAATTHHPVTGKKLHNQAAAVHHPLTGKKLHNTMKPAKSAKSAKSATPATPAPKP